MNLGTGFWYVLLAVVAAGLVIFGLGWHSSAACHDKRAARRQLEADQRTAAARGLLSDSQRAPMPTYAGWMEGTRWADPWGAQDRIYDPAWDQRGFIGPDTVPMCAALDMAEAAYQLGQDRAEADRTHAEAEAIWAEVEADPTRWQT